MGLGILKTTNKGLWSVLLMRRMMANSNLITKFALYRLPCDEEVSWSVKNKKKQSSSWHRLDIAFHDAKCLFLDSSLSVSADDQFFIPESG
jgi:hypothetical protein